MYRTSAASPSPIGSSSTPNSTTRANSIDLSTTERDDGLTNNNLNPSYLVLDSDEEDEDYFSDDDNIENDELEFNSDMDDFYESTYTENNSSDDILTNFTERNFTDLMNMTHDQHHSNQSNSPYFISHQNHNGSSSSSSNNASPSTSATINLVDDAEINHNDLESVVHSSSSSSSRNPSSHHHRHHDNSSANQRLVDLTSLLSPWIRGGSLHHHHHRNRNGNEILGVISSFGDMMFPLMQFLAGNNRPTNSDVVFDTRQAEEVMQAIPQITYRKDAEPPIRETSCAICLSDHEEQDVLRRLPCSHHFHSDCIDQWLKQQLNCPLCKQSVGRNASEVQNMIEKHKRDEEERIRESRLSPEEREKLRLERLAAAERKQKRIEEQKKRREEQHLRLTRKRRNALRRMVNPHYHDIDDNQQDRIPSSSSSNITSTTSSSSATSSSSLSVPSSPEVISLDDDDDDEPIQNNNNNTPRSSSVYKPSGKDFINLLDDDEPITKRNPLDTLYSDSEEELENNRKRRKSK